MMTAMMLPTFAPFAALYTRTLTDHRARRITELASGYLLVWTAAALPAYGARLGAPTGWSSTRPTAATVLAAVIFAACGIYQLTPIKDRCLASAVRRSASSSSTAATAGGCVTCGSG